MLQPSSILRLRTINHSALITIPPPFLLIAIIAGTLCLLICATSCRQESCVLYGGYWLGGRKDDAKNNNIWIEVNSNDPYSMTIYRDNNNDGCVDEVLFILCGQIIGVHKDSDNDGYIDKAYDFTLNDGDKRAQTDIPKDSISAGPFSNSSMDQKVKNHHVPRYSHLQDMSVQEDLTTNEDDSGASETYNPSNHNQTTDEDSKQ